MEMQCSADAPEIESLSASTKRPRDRRPLRKGTKYTEDTMASTMVEPEGSRKRQAGENTKNNKSEESSYRTPKQWGSAVTQSPIKVRGS